MEMDNMYGCANGGNVKTSAVGSTDVQERQPKFRLSMYIRITFCIDVIATDDVLNNSH